MAEVGFETLSVNYHMEFYGVNIEEQGPRMKAIAQEKGVEITTLGYYCNAVQFEEHQHNLERAIDAAHLYGAKIVSTFAGAYEGEPMEKSFEKFGEVFRELAKRAEDRGVRLAIENWSAPPATSASIPARGSGCLKRSRAMQSAWSGSLRIR
ncbi:MAG: TIM barrel protein [Clostridia bacterium]